VKKQHADQYSTKFRGARQVQYPRKNWSSVILFNCARCSVLTPDEVNEVEGKYLHQFRWITDEEIGELPDRWNHLVGIDEYRYDAALIHFTLGVPVFWDYIGKNRAYVDLWKFWQAVVAGERNRK
jgi:hypothetical protein